MRRFRVDRVSAARLTGEPACHRDDVEPDRPQDAAQGSEAFVPGPEATVAHLAVDDDAVWITEALFNSSSEPRPDGRTGVTLAVASTVWFGRLLLRLGPHAEVLDPPELAETGREAARQLLARYRDGAMT
jgi:proteasome accessory factor C